MSHGIPFGALISVLCQKDAKHIFEHIFYEQHMLKLNIWPAIHKILTGS